MVMMAVYDSASCACLPQWQAHRMALAVTTCCYATMDTYFSSNRLLRRTGACTGTRTGTEQCLLPLPLPLQMSELSKEVENGRLLRLLVKLGFINERPGGDVDKSWSETGDRYVLKLFRDHVFHQVGGRERIEVCAVLPAIRPLAGHALPCARQPPGRLLGAGISNSYMPDAAAAAAHDDDAPSAASCPGERGGRPPARVGPRGGVPQQAGRRRA